MNTDDTDFFVFDNTSKISQIFRQSVEIRVNPCPIYNALEHKM